MGLRPGLRPRRIPARHVGKAGMADLARPHEVVEHAHHLLDGGHAVPGVQEIEVDIVRLQPLERGVDGTHDVLAPVAAGIRIAGRTIVRELRGDDDMVAKPGLGDEAADKALAHAAGIGIRRVDEVAAGLDVAVEDGAGGRLVAAPGAADAADAGIAEGHGAERKAAHAQSGTAEEEIVVERHRRSCCPVGRSCGYMLPA